MRLKEARAALREFRIAIPKPQRGHNTGMHFLDLTGQRFGRWLASWPVGRKKAALSWLCFCDCGNFKTVPAQTLRTGQSRSCGCLHSEISSEIARRHPFKKGHPHGVRFQKGRAPTGHPFRKGDIAIHPFKKGHTKPLGAYSFDSATGKEANAIQAASPIGKAYKKLNAANDMLRQFRSSLMEPAPTKAES